MAREKKCECQKLKDIGSVITLGDYEKKIIGKNIDPCVMQMMVSINHEDTSEFIISASYLMNGYGVYSNPTKIKYCPLCGRKL